jgi:ACDE family multidrug resistance protein
MSNKPQTKLYKEQNLLIIFAVTLSAIMGVSSLTPAFPKIGQELHVSPQQIGLLITVFTIPGVFLTLVLGVLADRFGRKRILVPSLFLFAASGSLCAFAGNFHLLLILRFFQGIGAAALGSLNVTIIGDLYSGKDRTTAMGYNASVLSVGAASYPVIGGALAMVGWQFPFLLPVLAFPVGFMVIFFLKNPEPKDEQNLKEYLQNAWESVRKRQVIGLFFASIITFIILYGSYLTYFPFLIENRFNGSPFIIGVLMAAMSFTTAITSAQLGRLSNFISEKSLLKFGFLFYGVALLLTPFVPDIWFLLIPILIFGIGHGINIPNILTLLAGYAPMNQRGAVMSLNGMVLRIGQTLGPLLMGLAFGLWQLDGVFYSGAGFAIITLISIFFIIE